MLRLSLSIIFSILWFVCFAQPVNDDPCNAIPLDVEIGCNQVSGDNIGATNSSIPDPSCGGYNGEDVWFVILVPSNGAVNLSMNAGTLSNMSMAYYSASNCSGGFSEVNCSGGGGMPSANLTGLTPGSYLFIRVFDYYTPGVFGIGADPLEQGSFSICAEVSGGDVSVGGTGNTGSYNCGSTPAAGNTCETATPICTFDGYCGSTSGYSANYWSSGGNGLGGVLNSDGVFCGSIENNSFISFIAGASTVELEVEVSGSINSCDDGVQFMMFGLPTSGQVCQSNSIEEYGCESPMPPGNNSFSGTGLVPGQEYFLMVDGFAGDICDYQINAISGVLVEMSAGPDQTICVGESVELTIYGAGSGSISWTGPNLNTTTGQTVVATPTSTGTYQYIVNAPTISPACTGQATDQDTVLVTVVDGTQISVSAGTCVGGETVLTASGGSNFTWTPVGDLDQSTGSPVTASPVVSTTYNVNGTDANGCITQASILVEPCNVPCDTPSVVFPSICVGNTGVPTVDLLGGIFSFNPTPNDGATINSATGEISNVTNGNTYNITYTYTNYCQVVEVFATANGIPACGIQLCNDGVNLIASGGDGNFTWNEETTTTTSGPITSEAECVSCATANPTYFFGVYAGCDQISCNSTTTGWVQFGTGTSNAPPSNFPMQVVDGTGSLITYNLIGDIPMCSTSCVPPVLIVDNQSICEPNTIDLVSGINPASDSGSSSFYSSIADANSSVSSINSIVSTSGIYFIRLEDPADPSCYTVEEIEVVVNPVYSIVENVSTCENSTIQYPDGTSSVIVGSTSHISSLISINGCDSLITTNVSVTTSSNSIESYTLCTGSDFEYPDGTISTGILFDESHVSNLSSVSGCDSLITTNIIITNSITNTEDLNLCSGSDYSYPDGIISIGILVDESHVSNLSSINGCDSIVTTNIVITNLITSSEEITLCSGSDYQYPDGMLSTGILVDESHISDLISVNGCDSVVTTNLTVNSASSTTENISLCSGSDYQYPDGSISTSIIIDETYVSNLISVNGCDSIITTVVSILPLYSLIDNVDACENSTVFFPDGVSSLVVGDMVHVSNLTTMDGCDSVITSNVTMVQAIIQTVSIDVCSGSSYTYPDGVTSTNIIVNESQISSFISVGGCDSIITTLVNVVPTSTSSENVTICENSNYTFPDGTSTVVTSSHNYTSVINSSQGCDSIIITYINMEQAYSAAESISLCEGSSFTYPDGTNVSNVINNESHISVLNSHTGCDSIINTSLIILSSYNGAETIQVCPGESYIYPDGSTASNIENNESHVSVLLNSNGCDSTITSNIEVSDAPISGFLFEPETPTNSWPTIDFINTSIGASSYSWEIISSEGSTISNDYNFSWTMPIGYSDDLSACLTVLNINGCSNQYCEFISIAQDVTVYIPNTFTPDGNGINESFIPVINGTEPQDYEFLIFNRWGELIFETNIYGEPWDGTHEGMPVQIDTYVYKVKFKENGSTIEHDHIGHVNVIK
jgi:gliding motility-associated-like protein